MQISRFVASLTVIAIPIGAGAQVRQTAAATAAPASPPATKLEAFKPNAGSVVTFAYDELGSVAGASVDVREIREVKGAVVRGAVVTVRESEYRRETAFIDADEIPELLRGIDALLAVQSNPTNFKNFEVRYNTRGDLRLTAFNSSGDKIRYAVEAGRVTKAQTFVSADQVRELRTMFAAAQQKLAAP